MESIKSLRYRSSCVKDHGLDVFLMDAFFSPESIKTIMKPHRIRFYLIMFISDGNATHEIDFKKRQVGQNDIIFVSKDRVHNFSDVNNLKGITLLLSEEYLVKGFGKEYGVVSNLFEATKLNPYINANNDIIINQLHMIKNLFDMEAGSRILSSALRTLLLCFFEFYFSNTTLLRSKAMKNFDEILKKNINKSHFVKDYANKMSMSDKSLNRLVQKECGKSVKEYIQDQLLYEIKYRLCFSDLTLQEITDDLGFNEPSHLTNFFKKFENVSPTIYRNHHRVIM